MYSRYLHDPSSADRETRLDGDKSDLKGRLHRLRDFRDYTEKINGLCRRFNHAIAFVLTYTDIGCFNTNVVADDEFDGAFRV